MPQDGRMSEALHDHLDRLLTVCITEALHSQGEDVPSFRALSPKLKDLLFAGLAGRYIGRLDVEAFKLGMTTAEYWQEICLRWTAEERS